MPVEEVLVVASAKDPTLDSKDLEQGLDKKELKPSDSNDSLTSMQFDIFIIVLFLSKREV